MTPGQLRRMLGVKNRSTIHRYLLGERVPNPETMLKITRLTHFRVGLADFLNSSPPNCARIVDDEHGVPRIVLPWSPDYPRDDDPFVTPVAGPGLRPGGSRRAEAATGQRSEDDDLSRPVRRALWLLEGRAVFTRSGTFLLDGRICDLKDIVRAANAILQSRGEKPIPYPGVRPPHPDVYAEGVRARSHVRDGSSAPSGGGRPSPVPSPESTEGSGSDEGGER